MKQVVINIVKGALGNAQDNLYRAEMTFKGLLESDLDKEYEQSKKTCREIWNNYKKRVEDVEKCLLWLEEQ